MHLCVSHNRLAGSCVAHLQCGIIGLAETRVNKGFRRDAMYTLQQKINLSMFCLRTSGWPSANPLARYRRTVASAAEPGLAPPHRSACSLRVSQIG
jgi:hypothetical protein